MIVGKKPCWMRRFGLIPYNCEILKTGIYHKKKSNLVIQYKCGKLMRTDKCTMDQVKIKYYIRNCRMCYQKQNSDLTSAMRKSKCKTSSIGLPQCDERICRYFW